MAPALGSNAVTRCKQKIASVFSGSKPPSISVSPLFTFLRLPYDVRIIIYSYLDTEPPLSPRLHSFGLYRSCRQIKDELDEITNRKLNSLCCSIVENTPDMNVTVKLDSNNPKHITVTLPYTAFDTTLTEFRNPKWRRDVLAALQPLFALFIDMLHIHVSSQHCAPSNIPRHNTLRQKIELQDTMRDLLRDIGTMIDHQNNYLVRTNPGRYERELDRVFALSNEGVAPFPNSGVRVKRICLSWDLRSPPSDTGVLVGRWNEIADTDMNDPKPRKSWLGMKRRDKPGAFTSATTRISGRMLPTGYYLRDADHLVGEVGISSPSRWWATESIAQHVGTLVGNNRREGRLSHSEGLGRELASGLGGMRRKGFQEVEKVVDKVRAEIEVEELERHMLWLYMQEGITMD